MPSPAAPPLRGRQAPLGWLLALLLLAAPAFAVAPVEVRIEGIEGELLANVQARVSLSGEQARQQPLDDYRVRALYRRAPQEIREALAPFGYYDPVITPSLDEAPGGWLARFRVEPGEPVRVTAVEIHITGPGADLPPFREWRDRFPLKAGDLLHQPLYDQARDQLLDIAERYGFRAARLTQRAVEVNAGERSAVIRLSMATGPRYAFGQVRFAEVPLARDLLEHYLPFTPGDPFDAAALSRLQRSLADSDYFSLVEVLPLPPEGETIPVEVHLSMRERTRYTTGVGYGTDTGPRLTAGIERRWVNARGDRFDARATLSAIASDLLAEYRIPLAEPESDHLYLRSSLQQEQTDTSDRDTALLSVGVSQSRGSWVRSVALNYHDEHFAVGGESDQVRLLYPSISWQQISADDRIFPTRGWRLGATVRSAAEELGSDTSLLQGQLSGKYIHPLGRNRLIGRFDAGGTQVSDFEALPVSLRFFAGGDQSVRGYGYNTLGPRDAKGEVVGGRYLLTGSIEYDHYFDDRYGLALFHDMGSAFNDRPDTLDAGSGLGLRVRLPFAVVRLDVAVAVTDEERPWRLHLSIGPEL